MSFNDLRYKIIDDKYSFKCNISQEELVKRLKIWFKYQKEQMWNTDTGIFGHLNKNKSGFTVYYRFRIHSGPKVQINYDNIYIIGNIKSDSEISCTVNYSLVYDKLNIYLFKFIGLCSIIPLIEALYYFHDLVVFGDVFGAIFQIIGTSIVAVAGIIFGLLGKIEKKEDVAPALDIFKDFLNKL